MTDFEKAIRYLCFGDTDDTDAMASRYVCIEQCVRGDEDQIQKFSRKYEKLLDLLCM